MKIAKLAHGGEPHAVQQPALLVEVALFLTQAVSIKSNRP
jgi:hypothetical protein